MEKVQLRPLEQGGYLCVGLYYRKSETLNQLVWALEGVLWSKEHRCNCIPLCRANYEQLLEQMEGKAQIDSSILKRFIRDKIGRIPEEPMLVTKDLAIAEATRGFMHREEKEGRRMWVMPPRLITIRKMAILKVKQYSYPCGRRDP